MTNDSEPEDPLAFRRPSRGGAPRPRARPRTTGSRNEIIAQRWLSLETLWGMVKSAASVAHPPDGAPSADEQSPIDQMFSADRRWRSDFEAWRDLNQAEQCVGRWLTADQLAVEYSVLLAVANQRHFADHAPYTEGQKILADPAASLDRKRAAYITLLQAVQSEAIAIRFQRRLRCEVASRLFRYGIAAVALTLLAPAAFLLVFLHDTQSLTTTGDAAAAAYTLFSGEPGFALTMVATFGVLGAYFSRVISFQSRAAAIGFDDVMTLYIDRILWLRMLYGMIGSIMFYYFLRSGLMQGPVFPNLTSLAIGAQPIWTLGADGAVKVADGGRPQFSGLTVLAPTSDLAKLMVWSFIAGFSERLLPDTLQRTEAQSSKPAPESAAAATTSSVSK